MATKKPIADGTVKETVAFRLESAAVVRLKKAAKAQKVTLSTLMRNYLLLLSEAPKETIRLLLNTADEQMRELEELTDQVRRQRDQIGHLKHNLDVGEELLTEGLGVFMETAGLAAMKKHA